MPWTGCVKKRCKYGGISCFGGRAQCINVCKTRVRVRVGGR